LSPFDNFETTTVILKHGGGLHDFGVVEFEVTEDPAQIETTYITLH